MKFLSLVFSNLKHKKLRTILTLLSIFVAFMLFGILSIVKEAFVGGVSLASADKLVVRHKTALVQSLPVSYQARILSIPGVSACTHITWFGGIYKDDPKKMVPAFPVDPESYMAMNSDFTLPPEQMKAWLQKRNGAVVGRESMTRFHESDGWQIGSVIPMKAPIWGEPANEGQWAFEIVGVYDVKKKGADATQFLFRYDYFDEGRQVRKGEISWFSVRVKDPDQAPQIAKLIDQEFANSPFETKSETEAAFFLGFAAQIGDIGTIVTAVLGIVFFTILLIVGNTMAQVIRERTVELGVLKAIGFHNNLVFLLVIVESCTIAAIGGFLGLGAAKLLAAGGSPVPEMFPLFHFPDRDLYLGLGLVLALGLVSGAIPALQAMRLQIATALRR